MAALSDHFVRTRRDTVLSAALLILASFSNVKVKPVSEFWIFTFDVGVPELAIWAIALCAWYFFIYFVAVVLSETPGFLKSEEGGPTAAKELNASIGNVGKELIQLGQSAQAGQDKVVAALNELARKVQSLSSSFSSETLGRGIAQQGLSSALHSTTFNAISRAVHGAYERATAGKIPANPLALKQELNWANITKSVEDAAASELAQSFSTHMTSAVREFSAFQESILLAVGKLQAEIDAQRSAMAGEIGRQSKKIDRLLARIASWSRSWAFRYYGLEAGFPFLIFVVSQGSLIAFLTR